MRVLVACALAAACAAAAAQDAPRWYLQLDNDAVFATDRWYSSGLRLARVEDRGDHALEWGPVHEGTPEAKKFTREFDGQRVPHRFGSLAVHIHF